MVRHRRRVAAAARRVTLRLNGYTEGVDARTRPLTPKRKRFVAEYLIDLNATQAAIRAGYATSGARVEGARLLANANVQLAVAKSALVLAEKVELNVEWVLEGLKTVAERCMQAVEVTTRDGTGTGEYVFNAAGANKAYELIGKHLRMFTERLEVSDPDGEPLGTGAVATLMNRLEGIAGRKAAAMALDDDDPVER